MNSLLGVLVGLSISLQAVNTAYKADVIHLQNIGAALMIDKMNKAANKYNQNNDINDSNKSNKNIRRNK